MGVGLGGSVGGTTNQQSSSGSLANSYSPWQTALQGLLGSSLSSQIGGATTGTESPDVKALQTQSDNQINANYSTLGKNLNKTLAARGFGDSGATESGALDTELGRQGAIANNAGNFAGLQLNQNQGFLSDALLAAFNSMGNTTTGQTQGSGTSWGFGGGVSAGIPGVCWIAEAIYGTLDPRTHIARAWINGTFRQTTIGAPVVWVYSKIGRKVAQFVKRSSLLRSAFKPLFDKAVTRGMIELVRKRELVYG